MKKFMLHCLLVIVLGIWTVVQLCAQNVGINTTLPQAQLHVLGDSVIFESGQFGNQLVFSLEEFNHLIKSMQSVVLQVDSSKVVYLNPGEPDAKVIVGSYQINDNAIFKISSNNKGILIPKITQDSIDAMVLSMDDEGLLLYNVDLNHFQVYSAGNWHDIGQSKWQNGSYANSLNYEGNVGIKRASPQTTLDINGDATIRGRLDFRSTSGFSSNFGIVDNGTDFYVGPIRNESSMYVQADKDLIFRTDSLGFGERMRLVRNGNLGIGISSPSEKLEVNGNIAQRGDRFDLKASTGSNNDFSIVRGGADLYLGATKTGADLFVQADQDLRFRTKDTTYKERMVIKNNGFVGIGTENPDRPFTIFGSTGQALKIQRLGGLAALEAWANASDVFLGTTNSYPISVITGGNTRLHITSDGKVGIGPATVLSERLTVNGALVLGNTATNTNGALRYNNNDFEGYNGSTWQSLTSKDDADADPTNEVQVISDVSDPGSTVQVGIAVPGSPVQSINLTPAITSLPGYGDDADADPANETISAAILNGNNLEITEAGILHSVDLGAMSPWNQSGMDVYFDNGDVGIGTISPEKTLHIASDDGVRISKLGGSVHLDFYTQDTVATMGTSSNHSLDIITNNQSRITIKQNNTIENRGEVLCIQQNGNTPALTLQNDPSGGNDWWTFDVGISDLLIKFDQDGPGTAGTLTQVASVDDISGNWMSTSDERLKEDISPLPDNTLSDCLKLVPSSYYFTRDIERTHKNIGFIAQDVEKVFPGLVSNDGDFKSLDYSGFGVLAIKAIQEQQAIIDSQAAELKAVHEKLDTLEALVKEILDSK